MSQQHLLRQLPSISDLLLETAVAPLLRQFGHNLTVDALRAALDEQRQHLINNGAEINPVTQQVDHIIHQAASWLDRLLAPTLQPVINATGVIIHTNLGRAPLSNAAQTAVAQASSGYSTLEFDLQSGKRGSRSLHAHALLNKLTGYPAALTTNNNAAATLLMLTALCAGKDVLISRGQLVEIGGGFRIPDVLAQSGANLVEVGTTNRTHLADYANAVNDQTAAILVVHPSNYQIVGFTSQPELSQLAQLAQENSIPLLYDQGSGALIPTAQFGLAAEPTVQDARSAGVDLLCFSGDKLLGGPQAGILCGNQSLIDQIKKHPLARAVRADKLCLAALAATLGHYLRDEAEKEIPIWQMIAQPLATIEKRAAHWVQQIAAGSLLEAESTIGGGTLPGTTLPTIVLAINLANPDRFAARLRKRSPAVIGRIIEDQLLFDPRTVPPEQDELLCQLIKQSLIEESNA